MEQYRKVAKNTLSLFIGSIINKICMLIFFVLLASNFGSEDLGVFYFLFSLTSIFVIFSDFGLSTLVVREVARDKSEAQMYWSNSFLIKILLSTASVILIPVLLYLLNYPMETIKLGFLFSLMTIFNVGVNLNDSLFKAFEHFEFSALIMILQGLFILTMGMWLFKVSQSLYPIIVLYVLAMAVAFLIGSLILTRKFIKFKISCNFNFVRALFKKAYPFILAQFVGILYLRIDVLMLSKISGNAATGWYGAASKIILAYTMFPNFLITALFPILSRKSQSSKDAIKRISDRALKYLLIIGIPLILFTVFDAQKIILFLYKEDFVNSIIVMKILGMKAFFFFINPLLGKILLSSDKEKVYVILVSAALMLNVVLNMLLIPRFSYIGASIATVVSAFCQMILLYYFTARFLFRLNIVSPMIRPLLASSFMIFFVSFSKTNLFVDIGVAFVSYWIFLTALRTFTSEDRRLLRNVLSSGRP